MLQQTQVDRVLPKYHEWLSKYPTLASLATAPEDDVSTTWRPLGYNIRPRRLQWIAREAVARFGGALPSDEQTLLSFKGLGRYTVGAIRSFAFRQRAAILDTNVARVLFRVFVAKGDPKAHATVRHLWTLSEALVPHKHVFDFNQALMDFGATVCTARKPLCVTCPMRRSCASYPFSARTITKARRHEGAKAEVDTLDPGPRTLDPIVVAAAVVERDDAFLLTRTAERHAPGGDVGVSGRQVRARRDAGGLPDTGNSRGAGGGSRDRRAHAGHASRVHGAHRRTALLPREPCRRTGASAWTADAVGRPRGAIGVGASTR